MPYGPTEITRGAITDCLGAYFSCFDDGDGDYPDRPVDRPKYDDFVSFLEDHDDENSRLRTANEIGGGTWGAVNRRVKQDTFAHVFDQGSDYLTDISNEVFREGQVTIVPNVFLGLKAEVVDGVPSVPPEFANDLPSFGKGQAVVKAPDVEAVEVVGLDYCLTRHES